MTKEKLIEKIKKDLEAVYSCVLVPTHMAEIYGNSVMNIGSALDELAQLPPQREVEVKEKKIKAMQTALKTIAFEAKEPIIKVYAQSALDETNSPT